jgi:hypothetical protein
MAISCSKKEPVTPPDSGVPEPVPIGEVRIEGNHVRWSTNEERRASVRYGFQPGNWDHIAYPAAAGRVDRAFTTGDHTVPLLGLQPGQKVFFQVISEAPDNPTPAFSATDSFTASTGPTANLLVATMINIGFGDSHLVTMPTTGKRLVIDCGYRDAENAVETYYHDHGVTSVDAMLATHVHEDHLGGVVGSGSSNTDGVVETFPPSVFFDSPSKSSRSVGKPAYGELLRSLPAGTTRTILNRGDTSDDVPALRLDPQVRILCLNSGTRPGYVDQPSDYEGTVINNESIVLHFTYGDVDFVIGGDCEKETEASILSDPRFPAGSLEVEYFKCTHHGLSDANSSSWINTLRPRVGFIPNTRRVWDPPNEFEGAIGATVGKLQAVRADVFAIDQALVLDKPRGTPQYNVSFVTDGHSFEVRVELATQPAPNKPAQSFGCVQHALHAELEPVP